MHQEENLSEWGALLLSNQSVKWREEGQQSLPSGVGHVGTFLTAPFLQCRKDIAKVTIYYKQLNYQSLNESPLLSVRLLYMSSQ